MTPPEADDAVERLFDRYLELELEGAENAVERALAEAPDEATRAELLRQIELDRRVIAEVPDVFDANQRLGAYRLIEEVARGGQGIVYRAEQPSLGRDVAIKVLPPDRSHSRDHRKKLTEESRLLGGLQHPSIVNAIELLATDRGLCLVMSYLPFPSLQRLLEVATSEGVAPLEIFRRHCSEAGGGTTDPVILCCKLVESAARGLDAAHRAGVLHGDVKPSNLLIGKDGHPYLIDFGLATLQGPQADEGIRVHGTLPYVAPEVLQRGQAALSPASDIYGLAATLYEVLCGQPIFRADRFLELLRLARDESVPPLRTRQRSLPPELDLILRRALQRDPALRTSSALAFAEDLARFREGRALDTRGEPLSTRVRLAWRVARKRHRLWIGAAVASSLVIVSAWTMWPANASMQAAEELEHGNWKQALELFAIADDQGELDESLLKDRLSLLARARDWSLQEKDPHSLNQLLFLIARVRNWTPEEERLVERSKGLTVLLATGDATDLRLVASNETGEFVEGGRSLKFAIRNGVSWCAGSAGFWRVCFTKHDPTGLFPSYLVELEPTPLGGELQLAPLWEYADSDPHWVPVTPRETLKGQDFTDAAVTSFALQGVVKTKVKQAFAIDRFEFSLGRYASFRRAVEAYREAGQTPPFCHPDDPRPFDVLQCPLNGSPEKPVGFCDFYDAFAISTWAYARLPTEDEWEMIPRRRDDPLAPYSFDIPENLVERGIFGPGLDGDTMDEYRDVGNDPLPKGEDGIYHLHDNVGELTSTVMTAHEGGMMKTELKSVVVKGFLRSNDPDSKRFDLGLIPSWARYARPIQRWSNKRSWFGLRIASSSPPGL